MEKAHRMGKVQTENFKRVRARTANSVRKVRKASLRRARVRMGKDPRRVNLPKVPVRTENLAQKVPGAQKVSSVQKVLGARKVSSVQKVLGVRKVSSGRAVDQTSLRPWQKRLLSKHSPRVCRRNKQAYGLVMRWKRHSGKNLVPAADPAILDLANQMNLGP